MQFKIDEIEPRLAISVPEGRQIKPLVKAVLIYENFAAGVRAQWFCEKFVRLLDVRLEETNWSFDALGISEIREAAAGAARQADVVMLSVSGRKKLPGIVKTWLDIWLWLLDSEDPAFVALFDASAPQYTLSIRAYLSSAAREAGIGFFSHEIAASELPQFLGGESRVGHGGSCQIRRILSASRAFANHSGKCSPKQLDDIGVLACVSHRSASAGGSL